MEPKESGSENPQAEAALPLADDSGSGGGTGVRAGESSLRMMLTLGVAGLCSGVAVVAIFLLTTPRIERNRAEALEAAIFRVLDGAVTRTAFVVRNGALARFEGASDAIPKEEAIYAGHDAAGKLVGWAIPAQGAGFQDTIKLIYGYRADTERIVGMEVLESRETPGLGSKIVDDAGFHSNFTELAVLPTLQLVKAGKSKPNQVQAISGATISSTAVVRILNAANTRWHDLIATQHAGQEAAAPDAPAVAQATSSPQQGKP